ncbi:Hypothetical protein, putative [Bodo saltans]|uniref:Uncharacterized protein n=1 Tax=Bodo saltans TaxID=75058 RepID=A0A0S4JTV8_BODSA|nr:Hypothetical protein, putative [Bodo saltans]|eukprot:CUG93723.1 Hypothetical protein, putative [Bodo saltans]
MWASIVDYAIHSLTTCLVQDGGPSTVATRTATATGGGASNNSLLSSSSSSSSSVLIISQVRNAIPALLTADQWCYIALERNIAHRCGMPCGSGENGESIKVSGGIGEVKRKVQVLPQPSGVDGAFVDGEEYNAEEEDDDEELELMFCSSTCATNHEKIASVCRSSRRNRQQRHHLYEDPAVVSAVMALFPHMSKNSLMMGSSPNVISKPPTASHGGPSDTMTTIGGGALTVKERLVSKTTTGASSTGALPLPIGTTATTTTALFAVDKDNEVLGGSVWADASDPTPLLSVSLKERNTSKKSLVEDCVAAIITVTSSATRRELQRLLAPRTQDALHHQKRNDEYRARSLPVVLWECMIMCGELLFFDHHAILAARRVMERILSAVDDDAEEVRAMSLQLFSGPGGSVQHFTHVRMLFGLVLLRVAALAERHTNTKSDVVAAMDEAVSEGYIDEVLSSLAVPERDIDFLISLFTY